MKNNKSRPWSVGGGVVAMLLSSASTTGEAAPPVPDPAVDAEEFGALVGCWDLEVDLPFGTKKGTLCFEQEEGKPLAARLLVKKKWRVARSVTARPGYVTIVVDAPVGEAVLSAHFDEERMEGSFSARVGTRPFSATKSRS